MSKISVVIPTHNRGEILGQTIPSYLAEPAVTEVIIVDDGSTDDTLALMEVIRRQEPRLQVYSKVNEGAPAARNYGVSRVSSETEYVFFGEDDAFLGEGALDRLLECIDSTGADIAAGMIVPIAGVDATLVQPITPRQRNNPVNLNVMRANFRAPTVGDVEVPFTHALFLAKKWVFREVRFDENYTGNAYREETDFCLEASRQGAKIIYCPKSTIFHIEAPHGGQRRISKWEYERAVLRNNWYFLGKHYAYLQRRYDVKTPKLLLQLALFGRRVFLLLAGRVK